MPVPVHHRPCTRTRARRRARVRLPPAATRLLLLMLLLLVVVVVVVVVMLVAQRQPQAHHHRYRCPVRCSSPRKRSRLTLRPAGVLCDASWADVRPAAPAPALARARARALAQAREVAWAGWVRVLTVVTRCLPGPLCQPLRQRLCPRPRPRLRLRLRLHPLPRRGVATEWCC